VSELKFNCKKCAEVGGINNLPEDEL